MKVTALIPDDLVSEIKDLAQGRNLTESLVIALSGWVSIQKIKSLNASIRQKPLQFAQGFSAAAVREINRK